MRVLSRLYCELGILAVSQVDAAFSDVARSWKDGCGMRIGGISARVGDLPGKAAAAGNAVSAVNPATDWVAQPLLLSYFLPVSVMVVGPEDYLEAGRFAHRMGSAGGRPPLLWPRVSATVFDRRRARIMQRFGFELKGLFAGKRALIGRLGLASDVPSEALALEACALGIERGTESLGLALPPGPRLRRRIGISSGKIRHQLNKLALRSRASFASRRETAERRLEELCRAVVPGGLPQEMSLGPIGLALDHSPSVFARLAAALDVMDRRHQSIVLD